MNALNKPQAIAIGIAIALIVLLIAAPDKHPPKVELAMAVDARIDSAIALVNKAADPNSGVMPMEGIGMLLDVVEEDPENVRALLYLGAFSVQSGQYGKAVERLEKVVSLEPEATDAWFYLGVAYAETGLKDKALEALQEFKALSTDAESIEVAQQYINELKNS